MGLRLNLSEQPDIAIIAATHALASQIFYLGADAHVVGIQPIKTDLAAHADGIEDTAAGEGVGGSPRQPGREGVGGPPRQLGKADAPRCHQSVDLCD